MSGKNNKDHKISLRTPTIFLYCFLSSFSNITSIYFQFEENKMVAVSLVFSYL